MIVCADTSFLCSLLGTDAFTERSHQLIADLGIPLSLSIFHQLEHTTAALLSEFMGHKKPCESQKIIEGYRVEKSAGLILHPSLNSAKTICRATGLAEEFTLTQGHRTYVILLVAAALELQASPFLTFDQGQARLANSQGLEVPTL